MGAAARLLHLPLEQTTEALVGAVGSGSSGNAPPRSSAVLVLGLSYALNPMRAGFALLVNTRPRHLQNSLAYLLGVVIVSAPTMLITLALLHITSTLRAWATSATGRPVQIGLGVVAVDSRGGQCTR